MPYLKGVTITFNTHGDNKEASTTLHVFVKNRSTDTSWFDTASDHPSNQLSFQAHEISGPFDRNPYLAAGQFLAPQHEFQDPSSYTFELALRSTPIPLEEIILPVVNIHILPHQNDDWIFDYKITFLFDDGRQFASTSNRDGVTGIFLSDENRNYSGICSENPFTVPPPLFPCDSDAVLQGVCLEFLTTNDNKNADTRLDVHIVNRLGPSAVQDIAIGLDILSGQEFKNNSTNHILFGMGGLPLASATIALRDIVLPQIFILITPNGSDRWDFDYQVSYIFSNGQTYTSRTSGVVLRDDYPKYSGVYQGRPFPKSPTPGAPPANLPPDYRTFQKSISLSYLQGRLDEFINNRQGVVGQDPPIQKFRLHNTGLSRGGSSDNYYDVQSLVANPPPPGVHGPAEIQETIAYNSNPTDIGSTTVAASYPVLYFNDVRSNRLLVTLDKTLDPTLPPYSVTVHLDFDCTQPSGLFGDLNVDFTEFSLTIKLPLGHDAKKNRLALAATALGSLIDVNLNPDPGLGPIPLHWALIIKIQHALLDRDPFDNKNRLDRLDEMLNSWLIGGTLANTMTAPCVNKGCGDGVVVQNLSPNGDNLDIAYTRTGRWFQPVPPPNWPAPLDFSPGTLANIDHIVILTMENHSFDSMLGYLSLPRERNGMARTDVDGLKGYEVNVLRSGQRCPSFEFHPLDTIMTPDPPHDHESVHRAINGGKMDGFAQSYADAYGDATAYRIMGYYAGVHVPTHDALARDFAIGHRWFASHPGPTFCNRFYELTGMLNVDAQGFWEFSNSSPLKAVFTPTIFDHLTEQSVSWIYFEHHYCFLRFFQNYTFDSQNVRAFDDPETGFFALARQGALPSVSFIDPHFIELPPGGNCDGPPADIKAGQEFVRQVVEAVVASPAWNKTLLLVLYDEHGGFYDHVSPPRATQVSTEGNLPATYGVRVPAFVVSPWVKPGTVFGHDAINELEKQQPALYFDHTSILKTIARRFLSANPPFMSARYADANDLSMVLGNELYSPAFRPFIPYNFLYAKWQMRMEVEGGQSTPGTVIVQRTAIDSIAQNFSFEDAGGGYFRIRTHTGNLYLTVDDSLNVFQDVKYTAHGASSRNKPDRQRWQFVKNGLVVDDAAYAISSAHYRGKVLQPLGNGQLAGLPLVVSDPETIHRVNQVPNAWLITSPLIGDGTLLHA